MKKNIVIIGSVNTKGEQLKLLKEKVEERGHKAIIMDISMGGAPSFKADITPEEIASLVGKDINDIIASKDRFDITNTMTKGAGQKATDLLSKGELDGIVSLGGSTIALLGSRVMSRLPFGIPKVMAVPERPTVMQQARSSEKFSMPAVAEALARAWSRVASFIGLGVSTWLA